MAGGTVPTSAVPVPLYVYITTSMQALYERRGMWRDGPRGVLAAMLGAPVPVLSNKDRQTFYVTRDQLAALRADAEAMPPQAWPTYHQRAQFLRRLREAELRSGLLVQPQAASAARQIARRAPAAPAPLPFTWERPEQGPAKKLLEDHIIKTLRDFVDYSQGAAYTEGAEP